MEEFRYDTQLLIEGCQLDEDALADEFRARFAGDCLIAVGDETVMKIHFHTNEPWEVLSTAPRWARYSTSWSRTWYASPAASKADQAARLRLEAIRARAWARKSRFRPASGRWCAGRVWPCRAAPGDNSRTGIIN